eukprot:1353701-Amorphochlora_amoeboformis.AAC.1
MLLSPSSSHATILSWGVTGSWEFPRDPRDLQRSYRIPLEIYGDFMQRAPVFPQIPGQFLVVRPVRVV